MDKILKRNILLGALLGAISFIIIYGVNVLDFTYVDWLKNSNDLTQHYIGWEYFRNSHWQFPIGNMNNLLYPIGTSVTYMDCIPLFAILFKIINPILPVNFQYFGLWGILSFILTGALSVTILSKYIKNSYIVLVSSLFFIFSPIAIKRMFEHTSLAGHWIILLSLVLILYEENIKHNILKYLAWPILLGLSVLIHPYFTAIIFMIFVGKLVKDVLYDKKIYLALCEFLSSAVFSGVVFYVIGGFNKSSESKGLGLGYFSMNINSLFNSMGWSRIINELPSGPGQYEGFNYLGLGFITMLLIVLSLIIYRFFKIKYYFKNNILSKFKFIVPTFLVIIMSTIVSLSNTVMFNSKEVLIYELPTKIYDLWSIFRSTGRLFWGSWYIITFILVIFLVKHINNKKIAAFTVTCLLLLQLFDISNVLIGTSKRFDDVVIHNNKLVNNIWTDLAKYKKHITCLPNVGDYEELSYYAVENDLTLNIGYIAHGNYDAMIDITGAIVEDVQNGIINKDDIYIIQSNEILVELLKLDSYNSFELIKVDSYIVLFNNEDKKINIANYPGVYDFKSMNARDITLDDYLTEKSNLNDGEILIFSAKDEFTMSMDENTSNILKELGVTNLLLDKYRYSYAGYISNTTVYELLDTNAVEFQLNKDDLINNLNCKDTIIVNSAGADSGNYSNIIINDINYSLNWRGLNFVLYDIKEQKVKEISSFDSHLGKNGKSILFK